MAKRKGSPVSRESTSSSRRESEGINEREARKVESTQCLLDKIPLEVWEKILDHLDENDLFPLALSCRYFRQKQKELVARTRQSGPGRVDFTLALKTSLRQKLEKGQPASSDYLRFCSKEKVSKDARQTKAHYTRCLAAFHGHLPLLQKLLRPLKKLPSGFKEYAGESSLFKISLFWRLTCFSLSLLHSARRPPGNIEVAQEQGLLFG